MVQIYIKHTDNNFYLIDLEESEAINLKITVKDLNDITKIFSPFTQAFNIKASDKNKILCGFIGNEKIARVNNTGEFDAMIYISGFLFQSGKLTFEESSYENQDQKVYKTTFASNLSNLVDKLGDSTIQELFDLSDPKLQSNWSSANIKTLMSSVRNIILENGIEFKYGIPFISNKRVWTYDEVSLATVDNIAYQQTRSSTSVNFIARDEIRPAVNYMSIMNHLLLKIGTPIICPVFEKPEIKELFVWCNSESLVVEGNPTIPLVDFTPSTYLRYDTRNDPNSIGLPTIPRWTVTYLSGGIFKIKRNNATDANPVYWSDGLDIVLIFNHLGSLDGTETKIKVVVKKQDGGILDSQVITTDKYTWRLLDPLNGTSQLDSNGEIFFKYEVLPETLVNWSSINVKTIQKYYRSTRGFFGLVKYIDKASFWSDSINNTAPENLGGNKLNLITVLPKMKCVDFLRSFFKMHNITVVSTGLQDQSMYWLTPSDIQKVNEPYSKRIVTYDNGVLSSKKKANIYNQYSFSHKESKYYESLLGNGSRFGELKYPLIDTAKPTKFEVKTEYSILKQSTSFEHPSGVRTCLAFSNENPTVLPNGGTRYNPVFEEFTLFYLKNKSLEFETVSLENTPTYNFQLLSVLEASFKNYNNGKTLGFGAQDVDTDSLYLNNYKDFIELLLKPNTYLVSYELDLRPDEIFLNFSNTTQGESNIPTGFRAQNEIIIGEQRYQLVDAGINLRTGKTKLTIINL